MILALAVCANAALAQDTQTIQQIRVIGNRRIPKRPSSPAYYPCGRSLRSDFDRARLQLAWNTSYFDDLRIEREDSEKG